MSASSETCLKALKEMSVIADMELAASLETYTHGDAGRMYDMLRYFMGYLNEDFSPTTGESGKRFRPSLCLFIADAYGARMQALEAAVAIELFHNFTLVHDDVEDRDEYRRNKPTVWKLWGINHAINAGDAQSLLASEWAMRAAWHPDVGPRISHALSEAFIEVIEGQYLDFELALAAIDSPAVTEETYFKMIEKKSGVLVRIAAEAAGIAAGKEDERARLREFGVSLGMAYQMADDYRSVWATQVETGKDTHSDIREHKRTLPFLVAYAEATGPARDRLKALYSLDRQLTDAEVAEAGTLIDTTGARAKVGVAVRDYADRARNAVAGLALPQETRDILEGIVDMLVPEGREA